MFTVSKLEIKDLLIKVGHPVCITINITYMTCIENEMILSLIGKGA